MKPKCLIGLCVVTAASVFSNAVCAQAEGEVGRAETAYLRLDIGPAFVQGGALEQFGERANADVDYKAGLALSGAVGYHFIPDFAAELEFGAVCADVKSVPGFYSYDTYLNHVVFLVNLVYSRQLPHTRLVPHVGAGLGGAVAVFGTDGLGDGQIEVIGEETDFVFAWQVFAGIRIALSPVASLGVTYKYFGAEDSSFSFPPAHPWLGPNMAIAFEGVRAHALTVSLRVEF